jgi:catechol 2,3-dioxygenase-like lactoylglutathione lyase family enzyme
MTVKLNHTIVPARDKESSARFLADILGLSTSPPFARFLPLALDNDVTLDYMDVADPRPQHYAFLVSEDVFDAGFARVTAAGIAYQADPDGGRQGQTYTNQSGGRGFYFPDPDGHLMELLTRAPEATPPDQTGGGDPNQPTQPASSGGTAASR